MRPLVDDRAVTILRTTIPEFEDHYLDLLDIYDEDLTPQVVFNELADLVTELLHERDREETLERCFNAVECVAVTPGIDATELVAFCFLDQLPPFALLRAREYAGPRTDALLVGLERDLLFDDDPPVGDDGPPEDDDGEDALLRSDYPSLGGFGG